MHSVRFGTECNIYSIYITVCSYHNHTYNYVFRVVVSRKDCQWKFGTCFFLLMSRPISSPPIFLDLLSVTYWAKSPLLLVHRPSSVHAISSTLCSLSVSQYNLMHSVVSYIYSFVPKRVFETACCLNVE